MAEILINDSKAHRGKSLDGSTIECAFLWPTVAALVLAFFSNVALVYMTASVFWSAQPGSRIRPIELYWLRALIAAATLGVCLPLLVWGAWRLRRGAHWLYAMLAFISMCLAFTPLPLAMLLSRWIALRHNLDVR